MKINVLSPEEWSAMTDRLNVLIAKEEATDEFWKQVEKNEAAMKEFFSQLGEEGKEWEVPWHSQRSMVLYSYIYSDAFYTPSLFDRIGALIPKDGQPWYAECECYTEAKKLPNGNSLCLGWFRIFEGQAYTSSGHKELLAYASRLES